MRKIRRFNESSSKEEDFIEEIKQICMPLIDNGFGFKYYKTNTDFNSISQSSHDRSVFYQFDLVYLSGTNGQFIRFTNRGDTNRNDDFNELNLVQLEKLSDKVSKLQSMIPEIVDRMEDSGYEYEINIVRDTVDLKVRRNVK